MAEFEMKQDCILTGWLIGWDLAEYPNRNIPSNVLICNKICSAIESVEIWNIILSEENNVDGTDS